MKDENTRRETQNKPKKKQQRLNANENKFNKNSSFFFVRNCVLKKIWMCRLLKQDDKESCILN